ncbi:hypothetical protein [Novosphingobium huizhouense]|uniref:hypothetical protein n=1 Tax=Novosphingobium huizhouense TaxID=2866625 RepID=UPI001CD87274|nr:hypothetical protein [Novosphingobium huizhouense]
MVRTAPARPRAAAPWHLWAVAAIGLLWNAFGCYDYLMSKLEPESYFREMGLGPDMIAYMAAFPAWLTAFWALGVWGSLAGSVLLLARSRLAVAAFALSLLGLAVSQGSQMTWLAPPQQPPLAVVVTIWAALAFFLAYAAAMRRAGVLG